MTTTARKDTVVELVAKDLNGNGAVNSGDKIHYVVTVTNSGNRADNSVLALASSAGSGAFCTTTSSMSHSTTPAETSARRRTSANGSLMDLLKRVRWASRCRRSGSA